MMRYCKRVAKVEGNLIRYNIASIKDWRFCLEQYCNRQKSILNLSINEKSLGRIKLGLMSNVPRDKSHVVLDQLTL